MLELRDPGGGEKVPSGETLVGIDTGGTFTDFVVLDADGLRVHKVLSTPQAPERAILQGIRDLELDPEHVRIVHGTTIATNAVLEGKGVRTVYIGNRGLRDVLTIGRQARQRLYDLQPPKPIPPVPPERCLETGGRLSAEGEWIEPLTEDDLAALRRQIESLKPDAVAINLLFSFMDGSAERSIEAAMPEGVFCARSSSVLPEYREYERGMATWLTAYVGPLIEGYLQRLHEGLTPAPVAVMQSSGETVSAAAAGRQGVRLLLSGPAGGMQGARLAGQVAGCSHLMTFDMGGTSTDVALIDGGIQLTSEGHLGPYPVAVPMVDMHTIGAGGGSIAQVDAAGLLQVGPESAGANPGPACYGQGGTRATVTDANLLLGRLQPDSFLGGTMRLDVAAAQTAVQAVADRLSMDCEQAARGIIDLANEHMAHALRVISVERGHDPAEFSLCSFGGAGGLHVCALAEALGMNRALVPVQAGVLSALGMLAAPQGRQLSRTLLQPLSGASDEIINKAFAELEQQGRSELKDEGVNSDKLIATPSVDLRYQGQSFSLTVEWQDVTHCEQQFHELHAHRYGHRLDEPVELVNLRLPLTHQQAPVALPRWYAEPSATLSMVVVAGIEEPVPLRERTGIAAGETLHGPMLITEPVASTWLATGWLASMDEYGNLVLVRP